jgi:hypothetical protein
VSGAAATYLDEETKCRVTFNGELTNDALKRPQREASMDRTRRTFLNAERPRARSLDR